MSAQRILDSGKRIIILGGGLSGLSYAHYLRHFLNHHGKSSLVSKITVIESNDYIGGSVKSHVFEDGLVHEQGPRSVRAISNIKAKNTVMLLEKLGLTDEILTITVNSAPGKDRYIYRDKRMWSVPSTTLSLFKKLPASDTRLVSILWKDLRNKKPMDVSSYPGGDPPLYDFVKYRFGEEAAEAVLDPLLRGITAGNCRNWSTKGIFGDVLDKEQTYGGVMVGLNKPPTKQVEKDDQFFKDYEQSALLNKFVRDRILSYNLKTGLQTLPERLCDSLLSSDTDDVMAIYNQTKAIGVKFRDGYSSEEAPCSVVVKTVDGDLVKLDADHLVASIPANDLSAIIASTESCIPEEQKQALGNLSKIDHAPVGCVTVEYRDLDKKIPGVMNSFGFLTHSKAGSRLLGISFDSASFPSIDRDTGAFRMTCMMGGDWAEQVFGTSDMDSITNARLEQIALEEIRSILKIGDEPHRMSPILWKTGIAQYRPGHIERLEEMRKLIKAEEMPLTILGQSYDGVAVNDVIFSARVAANNFAKSL